MDCKEFKLQANDFLKENIDDAHVLYDFVRHFKECKECSEELEILYSMRRALGDIDSPFSEHNEGDYYSELNSIVDEIEKTWIANRKKKVIKLAVILAVILILLVLTIMFLIDNNIL